MRTAGVAQDKAASHPAGNSNQLLIAIHIVGLPKGCDFVFFQQVCTNSETRHHKMETKLNKSEVMLNKRALR